MAAETNRITVPAAEEILGRYFPVLDHGFVALVDYMGGDAAIEQATRVAYGAGTRKVSETRGLLRYLHRHRHTSPNEMCELKFHCSMPIFVARQWIRHRTANVNEMSGRYSLMPMLFYTPSEDQMRTQSPTNKQGRSDTSIENGQLKEMAARGWEKQREGAVEQYNWLVGHDFARELARIDLPLSTYTQWYWKIDLHNLLHFLTLRVDAHAQWEIQQYGRIMAGMLKRVAPISYEAWIDYEVCGARLSRMELEILRQFLALDKDGMLEAHQVGRLNRTSAADNHDLTAREVDELFSLFGGERAVPYHELDLALARSASYFEEQAAAAAPKIEEKK
jgi:thymidylate synthase (FAD)